MASVVFFEANPQNRARLGALLATLPDISFAIHAGNGEQLLHACRTMTWDLAIVELLAPGENMLAILATLRQECPAMRVMAISVVVEATLIKRCLDLGVRAMIASDDLPDEIETALRAVLGGQSYLSRAVKLELDVSRLD